MAVKAKTVLVVLPKLDVKSYAEAVCIQRIGLARHWNVFLAEYSRLGGPRLLHRRQHRKVIFQLSVLGSLD